MHNNNNDINKYYHKCDWQKMLAEAAMHESPCIVIKLGIIKRKYIEFKNYFPFAKIYYAVKANPANEIISLLRDLGSCFDIASVYELDKLLALGIPPDNISYGNTIKKAENIKYAYEKGVRLFVTDSEYDLRNLAQYAPGSRFFCRILTEGGETSDWPLSRKFGCHLDMGVDLIILGKKLGLKPYGISFHVGSQQRDIGTWDSAIAKAKYIFNYLAEQDIKLKMINMGGGFPAKYISRTNSMKTYSSEITRYLMEDFGDELPEIIFEPGRSLVAEAGIISTEVILVSAKTNNGLEKWVYLDAGRFNGLAETQDESIKYPIYCKRENETEFSKNFIIAGPTCDSQDIMYENFRNPLPSDIKPGDKLYWLTTGAYTSSYASVEFNGFPPIKAYFIN